MEPPLRRNLNIISGVNFTRSKSKFEAVCMDLKRSGLENLTHKPVIQADDMLKLGTYFNTWQSNPLVLLQKAWLDIMMFCCMRGREDVRDLSKTFDMLATDGSGSTFIKKTKTIEMTLRIQWVE